MFDIVKKHLSYRTPAEQAATWIGDMNPIARDYWRTEVKNVNQKVMERLKVICDERSLDYAEVVKAIGAN